MIELNFNNEEIPIRNFILHYVENKEISKNYTLKISLDEEKIITFIEQYSSCKIRDSQLYYNISEKDKINTSMGLLWKLKVNFLDKIEPAFSSETFPIFYNIKKVLIENDFLIIEGQGG